MRKIISRCKQCSIDIAPNQRICPGCGYAKYDSRTECTEAVLDQSYDLRLYGFSFIEIVHMLGLTITPAALRRTLWSIGRRFPRSGGRPSPFTAAQVASWRDQRAAGDTWKQIARHEPYSAERIAHAVRQKVKS